MADIVEKIIIDDSDFIKTFDNMASIIEKSGKEVADLSKDIQKGLSESAKKVVKTNDDMNKSIIQTSRSMREARADLVKQVGSYSILGISINDVKAKTSEFISILKTSREALIGNINPTKTQAEGIQTLTKVFGGGQKALLGFVKGLNIIRGAILATGIGALIIGLTGLYAWLTKSQEGMDFVGRKAAYVSGAFEVVSKKAVEVGKGIVDSFSNGTVLKDFGDLIQNNITNRIQGVKDLFSSFSDGGFLDGLKKAGGALFQITTGVKAETISNLGKEINTTASAFENIEGRMQKVRREQKALEVQTALNRSELEKYKKIGEDTTKSFAERIAAAKKAAGLELATLKQNESLARKELALIKEKNSLSEQTDATLAEEQKAQIKLFDFIQSSTDKQRELNNTVNRLEKEKLDLFKEQTKALTDLNNQLFDAAKEANLLTIDEQKAFILEKTIKALEEQKKAYTELGIALGLDVVPQLERIDKLISAAIVESRKVEPLQLIGPGTDQRVKELQDKIKELKITSLKFDIDTTAEQKKLQKQIDEITSSGVQSNAPKIKIGLKISAEPVAEFASRKLAESEKSFQELIDNYLEDVSTFEELFNKTLNDLLGPENAAKAKEFISGVGAGVNEFGNILNESINLQIQANERLIEDRQKQRKKIEDELEKEKELDELNLANNLQLKQAEVDALLAEEDKYQKENLELKKKAQQQQLILDTVQQAQSYITSSINIIKGFSNIPIVGLPLGIAAATALGIFFAKTKIEAFKATKLNEGTKLGESISDYTGQIHRHGSSDKTQSGYKVIRANDGLDTGVRLSGQEHVWGEEVSNRNKRFFEAMALGHIAPEEIDDFMYHRQFKKGLSGKGPTIINNNIANIKSNTKQTVTFKGKDGKQYAAIIDVEKLAEGQVISLGG